jgi:hypothetical protein
MDIESRAEKQAVRRARLAARLRQLNEEIRAYPQPIARCDAQLAGLVDERQRLQAQLASLDAERERVATLQGW